MATFNSAQSRALLKSFFGFDDFRGRQSEVVASVMNGEDTFVMMPTGGGKSLCYQLPALDMDGVAVVISPLIALMKNQVDALRSFAESDGVAHVWNSSLTKREMVEVRHDLIEGRTKLLYMAPESLNKVENIEFLRELNVSFYAIDEAHCISEWGHDFRPEYRQLRQAMNAIGRRPILALTATATPKVMSDILKTLEIPNAKTITTSFNRPNLAYEVEAKTANVERDIVKLLRDYAGRSAIVYCLSRQKVEELAQVLQLNGISALPYHAGLDANSRSRHQDAFLNEEVDVIVATVAFGMGIDKPDVRLVVHHDMPRSLEGYYQETGRAGRDGGEGRCVTFYAEKDLEKMDKFLARKPVAEQEIGRQLLLDARAYALSSSCRRKFLLHYFGEVYEQPNCGACDNCQNPQAGLDSSAEAQLVLETVELGRGQFRALQVVNTLLGNETSILKTLGARNLATWGRGADRSAGYWDDLVRQLMLGGFLDKDLERYGILSVTEAGQSVRSGAQGFSALPYREFEDDDSAPSGGAGRRAAALDPELYAALKALNRTMARTRNIPPYALFSEASLNEMATSYPISVDELKTIPGVGEAKAKRFGAELVALIKGHVEAHGIERPGEFAIRSAGQKGNLKLYIIQSVDRKLGLEEIARSKQVSVNDLLSEMENIVRSGTRLGLDYLIEDYLDDDSLDEITEYFAEESEDGSLDEATKHFDQEYGELELRLARLRFLCSVV
ncbi:MAG: RecQ family ATP-dependent DNA helicase [Schleiferiaceae bacterium]